MASNVKTEKEVVDMAQVYQDIRKKVYEIHLLRKKHPTVRTVLDALQQDKNIKFEGGKEMLRKILIKLGFVYHKVIKKRTRLMGEKAKIIILRGQYVRGIQKQREEGTEIVYADGKIIKTHGEMKIIVIHAGGQNGFIPGALMVIPSENESIITKETFEKWLKEYLIPNLQPNSVLAVNDTIFSKTLINQVSFSGRQEMMTYINENNIPNTENLEGKHMYELYEIVEHHLKFHKPYTVDHIMKENGHVALRIPNYHSDFNVAETMWRKVIRPSELNSFTSPEEVKEVIIKKFSSVPQEDWVQATETAKVRESELEDLYLKIDDYFDEFRIREKDGSLNEDSYSDEDEITGDSSESE